MAFRLPAEGGRVSAPTSRETLRLDLESANVPQKPEVFPGLASSFGLKESSADQLAARHARQSLDRAERPVEVDSLKALNVYKSLERLVIKKEAPAYNIERRAGISSQFSSFASLNTSRLKARKSNEESLFDGNPIVAKEKNKSHLRDDFEKLKVAVLMQRQALFDLKMKRNLSLTPRENSSEAILLRLIETSRLQRLKKSLEVRKYTASQKIENTKRRIAKITGSFAERAVRQPKDQDYILLQSYSEAQLQEILDCERLEFNAKTEFENDLRELLTKKLAKLESVDQAKSLIRQIVSIDTSLIEADSSKILQKMRENKNTMTTEKIIMMNNRHHSNQQALDYSACKLHLT